MADEATEEPEESAGEAEASLPQGSFLSRNWPLPTLALGAALMGGAVWYWRVPSAASHREHFLEDLARARVLAYTTPYNARPVLGGLFSRLKRVPEAKGEVYFLLGHVNDELAVAAENDSELAQQYRRSALEAYREADRVGVGSHLLLPLAESLGESLVQVGSPSDVSTATLKLTEALHRREVVAWAIDRRKLEYLFTQEAPSKEEIESTLAHAKELESLPSDLKEETAALAEQADRVLKDPTDRPEWANDPDPRFRENEQAAEVDERLRLAMVLDAPEAALEAIEQERKANDEKKSRILKCLALASLKQTPPSMADAEIFSLQRLALAGLSDETMADARLSHAEIMLTADRPAEAQHSLAKVQGTAEQKRRAAYLLGKSLLDRAELVERTPLDTWLKENSKRQELSNWVARQREIWARPNAEQSSLVERGMQTSLGLLDPAAMKTASARASYQQAIDTFRAVLDDRETPDETRLETKLWTGLALEGLNRPDAARKEYEQVVHELGSGPLDQAARFFHARSLGHSGKPAESIEMFKRTLELAGDARKYRNPYLRSTQVRDTLVQLWDDYQNHRKDYDSAVAFASLLQTFRQPDTDPGEPDDLFARSCQALAHHWNHKAAQETDAPTKAQWLEEARSRSRQAGEAFLKVAKAREGSDDFPSLLWESASDLFNGNAFDQAIPVFERFIVAHVGGPRDFLAKIRIAECHLARSNFDSARSVLENALKESATAVDRFRGRILLAKCYVEMARQLPAADTSEKDAKGLFDLAESLLQLNLSSQNQELEPLAADWRESLFALAQVQEERGRYDDAIRKYREYIRRYPNEQESVAAEHGIASCYFESAEELYAKSTDPKLSERDRKKALDERKRRLESSLQQSEQLVQRLTTRQGNQGLQRTDEVLLGASLARVGRIYMMLERWDEAIKAYENLAFRYLDRPDCLSAYIEMATAYQKLNRPTDAATALRQALWVIDRMDEKAFTQSDRKRDEIRQQIVHLLGTP